MISTELTVLSDRLYVPTSRIPAKRQVSSMQYSLLAPVIFTANIMNRTTSAENVTQMIRSADIVSADSEIIGFNSVGMCIRRITIIILFFIHIHMYVHSLHTQE